MRKNDQLKLHVLSNIDEQIIDEVTDSRIARSEKALHSGMKNRRRWITFGSIAASIAILVGVFLVLAMPLMSTKVPVYQGMTIRTESAASVSTDREYADLSLLSASYGKPAKLVPLSKSNGTPNGVANGHHKENDNQLQNKIDDLVTIDVVADDEVRYYVKPGETYIIEIHIENPMDYEIQSFTLNGKKYANYMFKEGSTMELLLLEVTAPEEPGYVEYTIDAIKYIDGTEIKDVDMSSGDKSVKAGIAYPEAPSASMTAQSISTTSAELTVHVDDTYSLIGDNELTIYLSDGEKIIDSKPLTVGDNTVAFNHLLMSTTYEYGVVTAFDMVDGRDLHKEWLLTNTFTTAGAFGINHAVATQDSISFEVSRIGEVGTVTAVSIYDAATDELVETGDADSREFKNLLSNHTYDLYVDFAYTVNGEEIRDWVAVKGITTIAKTVPTFSFEAVEATDTRVNGTIHMIDEDSIGAIIAIDLYANGEKIQENAQKELNFSGLTHYTAYQVVVTYTYDLNDGIGMQTGTATHDFKTAPYLEFNDFSVVNTSAVSEGDTIFLRVNITNPDRVVYRKIVVNGKTYNVVETASTTTMLICNIVNNGQFEGGNTQLTIEKVIAEIDGKQYAIEPKANNTAEVFILGKFEVRGIDMVIFEEGQQIERDYTFPDDTVYLRMTLNNKTGYHIDSVTLNSVEYTELIKQDDEHYILDVSDRAFAHVETFTVTKVQYSRDDFQVALTTTVSSKPLCRLSDQEIHYVSTAEDLLNMNSGFKYYEMTNDIDLAGIEWKGSNFRGVFNGNGYAIKNMTHVGTVTEDGARIGLFTSAEGVIENVHLESTMLLITSEIDSPAISVVFVGGIVANSAYEVSMLYISNCSIDEESVIGIISGAGDSNTQHVLFVHGMAGSATEISNCENSALLTVYSSGPADMAIISGFASSGGYNVNNGKVSVTNCIMNGDINLNAANGTAYGIAELGIMINCVNNGTATSNLMTHGIGIDSNENIITKCYALGENATAAKLSSKEFYTDVLGFDETIWNLDDLDIANGKYPTLR